MSDDTKCTGCGLFKKYWQKTCLTCELIKAGDKIENLEKEVKELKKLVCSPTMSGGLTYKELFEQEQERADILSDKLDKEREWNTVNCADLR